MTVIKGRLPLGLWYKTHSQNTSSPERDVCLCAFKSAVRPTQAGSERKKPPRPPCFLPVVLFYGYFRHQGLPSSFPLEMRRLPETFPPSEAIVTHQQQPVITSQAGLIRCYLCHAVIAQPG